MQTTTTQGLRPANNAERRCEIECIQNANQGSKQQLLEMWATATPQQAYDVLGRPDVV